MAAATGTGAAATAIAGASEGVKTRAASPPAAVGVGAVKEPAAVPSGPTKTASTFVAVPAEAGRATDKSTTRRNGFTILFIAEDPSRRKGPRGNGE